MAAHLLLMLLMLLQLLLLLCPPNGLLPTGRHGRMAQTEGGGVSIQNRLHRRRK